MKIRIGFGLGTASSLDGEAFGRFVDDLERLRFDSLWLSERLTGTAPDCLVGMAYAAGRTRRLKIGMSVMVLPGRNPVLLAKELATLDRLSGGRLLPAFGLGAVDPIEQQAFGVTRDERAPLFDETLGLLRRLWTEDEVHHHGARYRFEGISVRPKPLQDSLDVWLGGSAPSELRRAGRLADGWLPSFVSPDEAAAGRVLVEQTAERHGRAIDPEHFGALIAYATGPVPERLAARLAARRPDGDLDAVLATTLPALRDRIEAFTTVGFSKFVVVPLVEPPDWSDHLEAVAATLLPLQT